jgi:hypothetical protein
MTGISKVTFHTGFRLLLMDGVDCLEGPNSTTRYYFNVREDPNDDKVLVVSNSQDR